MVINFIKAGQEAIRNSPNIHGDLVKGPFPLVRGQGAWIAAVGEILEAIRS
jgi:hypothetical protein